MIFQTKRHPETPPKRPPSKRPPESEAGLIFSPKKIRPAGYGADGRGFLKFVSENGGSGEAKNRILAFRPAPTRKNEGNH
ncbi:MAG: hypothetical protein D6714_07750 [Bacteroidetes bacterium]|nr:MAG: hypothetical protein D6714_07750 [Bacteroidota bacterium]